MLDFAINPLDEVKQVIDELYPDLEFMVVYDPMIEADVSAYAVVKEDKYVVALSAEIEYMKIPDTIVGAIANIIAKYENVSEEDVADRIFDRLLELSESLDAKNEAASRAWIDKNEDEEDETDDE
jgi:septum formation inhibitor-activating ATPase MinD